MPHHILLIVWFEDALNFNSLILYYIFILLYFFDGFMGLFEEMGFLDQAPKSWKI